MTTESAPDPGLLWFEPDPAGLRCLTCNGQFLDRALVRTFIAVPSEDGSPHHRCSKSISLPRLQRELLLFDRHFECLLKSNVIYHAVSHVWDKEISKLQQEGRSQPTDSSKATRQVAVELPIRVYEAAMGGTNNNILEESGQVKQPELWHDYISVPQWTPDLKDRILGLIHDIFASANTTIVHFDDVPPESIRKLYHGTTSDDVLKGITDVCNARWFSRVWTAMELIRSKTLQMMLSDYSLCTEYSADGVFLERLHESWREEANKIGGERLLEKKVQLGRSQGLAPWNLGLPSFKKLKARESNFGQAFALLSRRGCREERDFLYAMRGLLATRQDKSGDILGSDFEAEYYRLARASLAAGDYSPLLITPAVPFVPDPRTAKGSTLKVGYNDVFTWGLGYQLSPPEHLDGISFPEHGDPRTVNLKLQTMGIVSTVHGLNQSYTHHPLTQYERFSQCAHITAQCTGPDVRRFASTLGSRIYSATAGRPMRELEKSGNIDAVQIILNDRYASPGAGAWQGPNFKDARWLADAMGLTRSPSGDSNDFSPLSFCSGHGGTCHMGGTRLNCLVVVTCFACYETEVFRVASFVNKTELRHATAYRIPGLRYSFTHQDGVGILVKDGKVVGRMIWAIPSCQCQDLRVVQVQMPGLPPRRPP